MRILHLCSNYVGTKVHLNQVSSLSKLVEHQDVLVPVYSDAHFGLNDAKLKNVNVKYFKINNSILKYFPLLKVIVMFISILVREIETIRKSEIVYAHTLWNNGVVGYFLSFIFNKRLIVSIRSTDFFVFMNKLPHYRWLMKFVIKRAEYVIFISPSYKSRVMTRFGNLFECPEKCVVIPNGIDNFWIKKASAELAIDKGSFNNRYVFVGRLNKTKRPDFVISIVNELRKNKGFENSTLTFIGCSSDELKKYLSISHLPEWINVIGKVTSKEELFGFYASSDCLLLPSYQETFGLVYLEALSSGCSVVLTKNEGISGCFSPNGSVLELDTENVSLIAKRISSMPKFSFPRSQISLRFSWDNYSKAILGML